MQSLCLILGGICLILSFVFAGLEQGGACLLAMVLGIIFVAYSISTIFGKKRKKGKQKKLYRMEGRCIHGLPYGEADCKIDVYEEYINFIVGKNIADLDMNRITSVLVKDKNELVGASAGNVFLGAALFGAIGGLIAARPKNKKEYVLIINYDDRGMTKEIAVIFDKIYYSYLTDFAKYITKRIKKRGNANHITL